MAWTGLALTVEGQNALNKAQIDGMMKIKSIVIGDGKTPNNFRTLKNLVHPLYEITELKIDLTENGCTLTAELPIMEYDYYFREAGVIVITDEGEKLYVYDNCGDDAQYIVNTTGVETTKKRVRFSLCICDVPEITVSNPSILYVSYDDFEDAIKMMQYPTFEQAADRENIESGERQSTLFGKIKKWLSDLKTVAFTGSYEDLIDAPKLEFAASKTITEGDCNEMKTPGLYTMRVDNYSIGNAPENSNFFGLLVLKNDDGDYVNQMAFLEKGHKIYLRTLYGGEGWSEWKKLYVEGDEVDSASIAKKVYGKYSWSEVQVPPSYIEPATTRFNMLKGFLGIENPSGGYMDAILMDNYNGSDVPWVTGIAVTKNNGNPRMFIANGAKGNTEKWAHQVEAITTANIGGQSVATATKAAQDGNGNNIANTYAIKSIYGEDSISMNRKEGTTSAALSIAFGLNVEANRSCSAALGGNTTANNNYSLAIGYNNVMNQVNAGSATAILFAVGGGLDYATPRNAFSVRRDGMVKAASTITASTTADYAEFFEWLDGNLEKEDRVGRFVTMKGDKILLATDEKDYILGIVSGQPFVLGNGDCDTWNGMVLRDEFGRVLYEPAPKTETVYIDGEGNKFREGEEFDHSKIVNMEEEIMTDADGNVVYEGEQPVINPDYDPNQTYVSRFERPEWSPVGMLGVLSVYDDGTCQVNGYCRCGRNGAATSAESGYRVIKRVADNIVKVIFR